MAGALVAVSASSGLTVFMHAPWQLDLLWGVVNGLATGAVSVPLAAIIANRWFVERRGLVTGLLTASNATGLGRDRAADGRAHRGDVRPRACRGRLRLGLLRAPARRGSGGAGRGRPARLVRGPRRGVWHPRPALP